MQDRAAKRTGASNATPQKSGNTTDVDMYKRFVGRALQTIYDEKIMPRVIEMLDGEGDPMEGLASAAAMITSRVATTAEKGGATLTGDVVFAAGREILQDLAELSRIMDIKDYTEDNAALEGAWFRAIDKFRGLMEQVGRVNPETASKQMEMLAKMDESGELETKLRDMAMKAEQRGRKGAPVGLGTAARTAS